MEEYIEACTNMHRSRTGFCVERVNDSKSGFQRATSNAGLERLGSDIKDSGTGRLRASPSSSWNLITQNKPIEGRHMLHIPAIRGRRVSEMARPFPIGALMKSYKSASLYTVNLWIG